MILYAASDLRYFVAHGLEFAKSCVSNENKCLIKVFPTTGIPLQEQIEIFQSHCNKIINFVGEENLFIEWSAERVFNGEILDERAYYASYRFLTLVKSMKKYQDNFLVLDIDSVVDKKIPEIEEDIGVYLRLENQVGANAYEIEGMKVAAGILYVSMDAIEFAMEIEERIRANPIYWFNDQHAIYNAYKRTPFDVKDFSIKGWLDWSFETEALIYTGKGQRKNDQKYLSIKEKYSSEYCDPNVQG